MCRYGLMLLKAYIYFIFDDLMHPCSFVYLYQQTPHRKAEARWRSWTQDLNTGQDGKSCRSENDDDVLFYSILPLVPALHAFSVYI